MKIDSFIIDTYEAFESLKSLVSSEKYEYVSLDLETDSAIEKIAKIHGLGLSFTTTEGFYFPIRDKDKQILWSEEDLKEIYAWTEQLTKKYKLIGWNLIFDTLVWENNTGNNLSDNIYSDGILLKHVVDEERPFALKEVAVKYLGEGADLAQEKLYASIETNGGSTTKDNTEMYKADPQILAEYCVWDTVLARKLFDIFQEKLIKEGLHDFFYKEEVIPLYHVTIQMKRFGFPVDVRYFENLHESITKEIQTTEKEILGELREWVEPFTRQLLDEEFPCSRAGNFPKMVAKVCNFKLPEKNGKVTIAKAEVAKISDGSSFYKWLLREEEVELPKDVVLEVQHALYQDKYPDKANIFNLNSTTHLGWLFFERFGLKPLSKTEGGKPQCDDDFLESIKTKYPFVAKLIDYKKLQKLDSTYIMGILERQLNGVLYSSFLQFGTTSGRYSSTNPNLQNIPRTKDDEAGLSSLVLHYVNAIKKGFVAPVGYKIVNSDYSQLEPSCFAHVSGDPALKEVFINGFDLYSQIAIDTFGVTGCSANKKDKNYLKNIHPELRQKVKVFALAVPYGAGPNRIAEAMNVDYKEAERIIEDYLDAYPGLRNYMDTCHKQVNNHGFIKTDFGRIRHLPQAKNLYSKYGKKLLDARYCKINGISDLRYTYRNALNNSSNFPIQGLASHIVNRAMIETYRLFKVNNIEGYIGANVHDEISCVVREDQALQAKDLLQQAMENTTKISVPLYAVPLIGANWSEAK